jgi:hypothetical protein
MSKSDSLENSILKLLFQGVSIDGIATATATVTSFYVSLHTADPGDAGNQSTSEISYTGYARQALTRTTTAWSINGSTISPVNVIAFPTSTGGATTTATYMGIGTTLTGTGTLLYSGPITPALIVYTQVQLNLGTTTSITED